MWDIISEIGCQNVNQACLKFIKYFNEFEDKYNATKENFLLVNEIYESTLPQYSDREDSQLFAPLTNLFEKYSKAWMNKTLLSNSIAKHSENVTNLLKKFAKKRLELAKQNAKKSVSSRALFFWYFLSFFFFLFLFFFLCIW